MILLIRDNECFEPRVRNYIDFFSANQIPFCVIGWDRRGTCGKENGRDEFIFFDRRAEYGKRLRNIPNKLAWMAFVVKQIVKHRKECSVIHACDIDAAIPAMIAGKLLRKKVVFDIFDWISSLTGRGLVYRLLDLLQNRIYKKADFVILCEEGRKAQAKSSREEFFVLPNLPNDKIEIDRATEEACRKDHEAYALAVSYVGVFDRDRGLENLLTCISELPDVKLDIAGFGVLDELVSRYAQQHPNIQCWGRVEYAVGQTIMKNSDLIAAMYHLTSPLHKFAAPNKYYESLKLGVPVITTEATLVANKVNEYGTGFVIGESREALETLLNSEGLAEQIAEKKTLCEKTWNEVYSNYFDSFMRTVYCAKILGRQPEQADQ